MFYNGRVIDEETKVFVYYNLHKHVFSVKALEGEHKGKVVLHSEIIVLKSGKEPITFKVSEAGRQRVIAEQRKNVHAGVVGYLDLSSSTLPFVTTEVTYNPYKYNSFVYMDNKQPIKLATNVVLSKKKVFVMV